MKEGVGIEFTGVVVNAFCHDGAGRFLVQKRSQNARDEQGTWCSIGGGVKFGERIEDALARELKEEHGAKILEYDFLGYDNVIRTQNGRKTHWIRLDFLVRIDPSEVIIGEPYKCEEFRWVTLNTIPTPMHPYFVRFLERHWERFAQL